MPVQEATQTITVGLATPRVETGVYAAFDVDKLKELIMSHPDVDADAVIFVTLSAFEPVDMGVQDDDSEGDPYP